jgi:WD40 repeat protein
LFLWRIGKIKENAFWQNVSVGFPLNARESYLMGLWHIEAGDLDHGTALLNSALSFGTLEPGEQFSARSTLNSISKSLCGRTHLKGMIGNATALAFSADHAKAIACGGAWKSDEKRYLYINLKVWELSTDKCVSNAKGHSEPILCVMTTSDSQIAITGSSDKTVGIWDLKSGSCSSLLKGHAGAVNSVAITRDDSLILSGSEDGTIRAWEINSRRMFKVFGEHFGPVKTVAVSTSIGASACDANTKIWSVINGKTLATLPFGSHSLAISNNEKFMLAASTLRLRLIEIGTTDVIQDIEVPGGACSFAALSIDGLWGLSVGKDIRFWDMRSGRCSQVIHVKAIQAGFLSGSRWWYRTKECIQIAEKFLGFSSPYALSRPPKPTRHDLFTP